MFVVLLVSITLSPPVMSNADLEEKVKAVYIYKLLSFVEWKNASTVGESSIPINLCIIGNDPITNAIQLLEGKKVNGRSISVYFREQSHNLIDCHVLFITRSRETVLNEIMDSINQSLGIITISDILDFAESGGMVELLVVENRVKLVINHSQVRHSAVKFSSKLLAVSILIDTDDRRDNE